MVCARVTVKHAGSQLWVDKWKPETSADLVGNVQSLQILRQWLGDWQNIHIRGQAPKSAPGARGAKMDMTKKAILLAGPPGIGKTTAAATIARCGRCAVQSWS